MIFIDIINRTIGSNVRVGIFALRGNVLCPKMMKKNFYRDSCNFTAMEVSRPRYMLQFTTDTKLT